MKDASLAQDSAYERRRSPGRTIAFAVLLAISATGLVVSIVFYQQLLGNQTLAWRGTRISNTGGGIVAPGAVLLCLLFTVTSALLLATQSFSWFRRTTGSALKAYEFFVDGTKLTADEVHRRLSTRDPAVYRPLPVVKRGRIRVRLFWATDDQHAVFTVHERGRSGALFAPIPLDGDAYTPIIGMTPDDYARPHPAPGGPQPFGARS